MCAQEHARAWDIIRQSQRHRGNFPVRNNFTNHNTDKNSHYFIMSTLNMRNSLLSVNSERLLPFLTFNLLCLKKNVLSYRFVCSKYEKIARVYELTCLDVMFQLIITQKLRHDHTCKHIQTPHEQQRQSLHIKNYSAPRTATDAQLQHLRTAPIHPSIPLKAATDEQNVGLIIHNKRWHTHLCYLFKVTVELSISALHPTVSKPSAGSNASRRIPSFGALHFHKRNGTKRLWSNSREFTTNLCVCFCSYSRESRRRRINAQLRQRARSVLGTFTLGFGVLLLVVWSGFSPSVACGLLALLYIPLHPRGLRAPVNETARGGECEWVRARAVGSADVRTDERRTGKRARERESVRERDIIIAPFSPQTYIHIDRYIITPVCPHRHINTT